MLIDEYVSDIGRTYSMCHILAELEGGEKEKFMVPEADLPLYIDPYGATRHGSSCRAG